MNFRKLLITLVLIFPILVAIPVIYAQTPTQDATAEATDEATAEATMEVTDEATMEATDEATAEATTPGTTATTVPLATDSATQAATAVPGAGATVTSTPVPGNVVPSGPPYVCDTTTLTLLLVAETFGFSESQFAEGIVLDDYDLGGARVFFEMIQPVNEVPLDERMQDTAMLEALDAFMVQFEMEDVTELTDISVTAEDPACLTLRQAAQQYILLNIIFQQMELQSPQP